MNVSITKNKVTGELRDGGRLLLRYRLDHPHIEGSEADEKINALLDKMNSGVLHWLDSELKSTISSDEQKSDRRRRLYFEPHAYSLSYVLSVRGSSHLYVRIVALLDNDERERSLLLSLNDGAAESIRSLCGAKAAIRYRGCEYRLSEEGAEIRKNGRLHKIALMKDVQL